MTLESDLIDLQEDWETDGALALKALGYLILALAGLTGGLYVALIVWAQLHVPEAESWRAIAFGAPFGMPAITLLSAFFHSASSTR
jgi:hypothetical protein